MTRGKGEAAGAPVEKVLAFLAEAYPGARVLLEYRNPFELLVATRLGLTGAVDPVKIEAELAEEIPRERWWEFATRLGWHGRKVCAARKPRCAECGLEPLCPRQGLVG